MGPTLEVWKDIINIKCKSSELKIGTKDVHRGFDGVKNWYNNIDGDILVNFLKANEDCQIKYTGGYNVYPGPPSGM